MTLPQLQAKHERELSALIRAALRECSGNVVKAADALAVKRTSLIRMIERLSLQGETSGKVGRPPSDGA